MEQKEIEELINSKIEKLNVRIDQLSANSDSYDKKIATDLQLAVQYAHERDALRNLLSHVESIDSLKA